MEEIITEALANGLIKAIEYIERNLIVENEENSLKIDKIAQKANISSSYLQKYFKKFHKVTLHTYIMRRKMTLASYDLINTKDTNEKIAIKYGYEPNSFWRCFEKIFNKTPDEYRKNGIVEKEFLPIHIKTNDIEIKNDKFLNEEIYLVEKKCMNCEFCIGNDKKIVCAGRSDLYGEDIENVIKIYPNGCEEFEYTLEKFILNEKLKEENKK